MKTVNNRFVYLGALMCALVPVLSVFPHWALTGQVPPGAPPTADFAQQIVGQRYFLPSPWHWPVLNAPGPMSPWGVNIAFTDSNPLASLIAKAARPFLPPFDQVVTLWQALCWLLQPAAAIFALRSAGERRVWPALAAATLALLQPAFLAGFWHASLSSHFVILIMVGLYFRIVRGSRASLVCACCLLPVLLLIHPYLVFMDAAILAAAPVTLAYHRMPGWPRVSLAIIASFGAVAAFALLLGYQQGHSPGGYGIFSMNLLAPWYPARSGIVPGLLEADIDATGGQRSNDAYLGMGLALLIAATLTTSWPAIRRAMSRHPGLMSACLALTLLAISNRVTFGKLVLFRIHMAVGPLEMIRASSRLAWPVSYIILIGCVLVMASSRPKRAVPIVLLAVALQSLDASKMLFDLRAALHRPEPWLLDPVALRVAAGPANHITVLPPFGCTPGRDMPLMQVLWIASERRLATNTAYVARTVHPQSCHLEGEITRPAAGDLLVIQPGFREVLQGKPWAPVLCHDLSDFTICEPEANEHHPGVE